MSDGIIDLQIDGKLKLTLRVIGNFSLFEICKKKYT